MGFFNQQGVVFIRRLTLLFFSGEKRKQLACFMLCFLVEENNLHICGVHFVDVLLTNIREKPIVKLKAEYLKYI